MAEKLKEYCTVISGYAFKSKDLSEGTDIPVIKIGNISNGKNVVIDDSTQYVNEEFLSVDEKYHIKNGDILISLTGSHMNQPNSIRLVVFLAIKMKLSLDTICFIIFIQFVIICCSLDLVLHSRI